MNRTCSTLAFALATAASAHAADTIDFADYDRDRDGRLSRVEIAQDGELSTNFSRLDADGDGYLSREELREPAVRETAADGPVEDNL